MARKKGLSLKSKAFFVVICCLLVIAFVVLPFVINTMFIYNNKDLTFDYDESTNEYSINPRNPDRVPESKMLVIVNQTIVYAVIAFVIVLVVYICYELASSTFKRKTMRKFTDGSGIVLFTFLITSNSIAYHYVMKFNEFMSSIASDGFNKKSYEEQQSTMKSLNKSQRNTFITGLIPIVLIGLICVVGLCVSIYQHYK